MLPLLAKGRDDVKRALKHSGDACPREAMRKLMWDMLYRRQIVPCLGLDMMIVSVSLGSKGQEGRALGMRKGAYSADREFVAW